MKTNLKSNLVRILVVLMALNSLTSQMSIAARSHSHHRHHHRQHHSKHHRHHKKKHRRTARRRYFTPVISAQNFDQQYLRFLRRWQMPGSSVAIMQNDKFILARGYGWADVENRRAMTPDSVFRIASVSKAITAVATLKLAQEGKISLDSKAYEILDDLQPLTNTTPSSRIYAISVRNLLEMSSGWITDHGIDPMLGAWSLRMRQQLKNQIPPDCRNTARLMMTMPMQYTPGTHYSYSNMNYCLLGLIINKITGQSGPNGYENYVKRHILEPLGITSMRIGDNTPGRQSENEVRYYLNEYGVGMKAKLGRMHDGLPYGHTDLLQKNYSDGGWVASAPDLAKFLRALSQYKILSPEMIRVMTSKPAFQNKRDYFAKGWSIKHLNGHLFMLKTGSFTGTQALVMLEDDGTSYVALFNAKPSNRKAFISQLQRMLIAYSHKMKHTD